MPTRPDGQPPETPPSDGHCPESASDAAPMVPTTCGDGNKGHCRSRGAGGRATRAGDCQVATPPDRPYFWPYFWEGV